MASIVGRVSYPATDPTFSFVGNGISTYCYLLPAKLLQVVEKRYERRQDKAKFGEKAESIFINEHFEPNLTPYCQAQ